jgi:hypothetical protein
MHLCHYYVNTVQYIMYCFVNTVQYITVVHYLVRKYCTVLTSVDSHDILHSYFVQYITVVHYVIITGLVFILAGAVCNVWEFVLVQTYHA